MSSLQESPIGSPTSFQPDLCTHNPNQSPVSEQESQDDNIEWHPSDSLVHDNSVHYPSPVCGFCRISSQASSRAFSSDRPLQSARNTYAETLTVAADMTALTPWLSLDFWPRISTTCGPSSCPDSWWSWSKLLTRSLNESCLSHLEWEIACFGQPVFDKFSWQGICGLAAWPMGVWAIQWPTEGTVLSLWPAKASILD